MSAVPRPHYAPTPAQRQELRARAAEIRAALARHREQKKLELAFSLMLAELRRPRVLRDLIERAVDRAVVRVVAAAAAKNTPERTELEDFLEARFLKADARRFLADPTVISGFGRL